jgi:hypothetical protein
MNDTDNADMAVQLLHDCICNAAVAVHGCRIINHGLILNVAASTKKYLHMQSFTLTAI